MAQSLDGTYYEDFYRLEDVINANVSYHDPYITQYTIPANNMSGTGYCVRYRLFKSFETFLQKRSDFDTQHEILACHCSAGHRTDGRLVFDLDFTGRTTIDFGTWHRIEEVIVETVDYLYNVIRSDTLEFVWSTSDNPNKISKHLTVKNLVFDNWIEMSKQFYARFITRWNALYPDLPAFEFVDTQIARSNASLRMIGNYKPNKQSLLKLDNDNYTFVDSLIRPPKCYLEYEQKVKVHNLRYPLLINPKSFWVKPKLSDKKVIRAKTLQADKCPSDLMGKINQIITKHANLLEFAQGIKLQIMEDGTPTLQLRRGCISVCPQCKRPHEGDNAYIKIKETTFTYHCFRNGSRGLYPVPEFVIGTFEESNAYLDLSRCQPILNPKAKLVISI